MTLVVGYSWLIGCSDPVSILVTEFQTGQIMLPIGLPFRFDIVTGKIHQIGRLPCNTGDVSHSRICVLYGLILNPFLTPSPALFSIPSFVLFPALCPPKGRDFLKNGLVFRKIRSIFDLYLYHGSINGSTKKGSDKERALFVPP